MAVVIPAGIVGIGRLAESSRHERGPVIIQPGGLF